MQINWIAKDEDGDVWGFESKPERGSIEWFSKPHRRMQNIELPGRWQESLRPYDLAERVEVPPIEELTARSEGAEHYTGMDIQPWDVIDTWPIEQRIGFYRGNLLKYTMRCGSKDAAPAEIKKAAHYAKKLLEVLS
jgi:hypothetical protein